MHSIYTTKCALYLNYKLYWRKQFIAYSKKAKSFWQIYESVGKIVDKFLMYFLFGENEQCGLICKHPSFWQSAKGKEAAQHLAKLCENQNLNKNSMKHVQQHHFLFKTANRVTEMFPKTLCLFACFSFFFSRLGINRWTSLEARLYFHLLFLLFTSNHQNWIVSKKTFSLRLQPEN